MSEDLNEFFSTDNWKYKEFMIKTGIDPKTSF